MNRWDEWVNEVEAATSSIRAADDAAGLLKSATAVIEAAEDLRDLALLAARDQGVAWTVLAEIGRQSPTGVRRQHDRAAERFRKLPESAGRLPESAGGDV